jgi:phosphate butyryltransferase
MPLPGFDALWQTADRRRAAIPVAIAGAADATVLAALREAHDRGWVRPLLVDSHAAIRQTAEQHGISLTDLSVIDSDRPAEAAVAEVVAGRARLLMKGQIATPQLMQAILHSASGLRTTRTVCQVVLMEIARSRRFLLADTGVCLHPTLEQKIDIARSAVEVASALGADEPRVALLAASESVSPKMPETVDAAAIVQAPRDATWPRCHLQGPLSFDLAYAADAGDKKRVSGHVVGAADVLLFPNLLSANLTVKAIMYTADCRFGGVLCGAACPVVFMSRADSAATRLNSLALALGLFSG